MRTILAICSMRFSNRDRRLEVSVVHGECRMSASRSLEHEECPFDGKRVLELIVAMGTAYQP